MRAPSMPTRAYFVKQLLLQGFLYSADPHANAPQNDYTWYRRAVYAGRLASSSQPPCCLGMTFSKAYKKAYSIQNDLARYHFLFNKPKQRCLVKSITFAGRITTSSKQVDATVATGSILAFILIVRSILRRLYIIKHCRLLLFLKLKMIWKISKTAATKIRCCLYCLEKRILMLARQTIVKLVLCRHPE